MSTLRYLSLVCLALLVACSNGTKELPQLSTEEKGQIENYAKALVNSINEGDHSLIRNSFNYEAFPELITGLSRSEQMVLDYSFLKSLKDEIKYHNLELVNQTQLRKGKVTLCKITHRPGYSEIQLIIQFEEQFNFLKYRVDMINGKPFLTDFYYLKEGSWFSELTKNTILLSSEYTALSGERKAAYNAHGGALKAAAANDFELAIYFLNKVPKSHWLGDRISFTKLQFASQLGDSTYAATLEQEAKVTQNLYIQMQLAIYRGNTTTAYHYVDELMAEVGNETLIDSLFRIGHVWF